MAVLLAATFGLILGSFLSVLISRWPTWRGVVMGRSQCPACGHILAWYELIPVVSWMVQYGRCRTCGIRVPLWYPLYELTMATVLAGYVMRWGVHSWWAVSDLILLALLMALFFFDLRRYVLPDVLTVSMAVIALVRLTLLMPQGLVSAILTALGLGGFFAVLWLVSRGRWVGAGDIKMGAALGLVFAFPAAPIITIEAVWAGALVGVGLLLVGRATRTTALPFGTFWVVAAVIAMLWPQSVVATQHFFFPL